MAGDDRPTAAVVVCTYSAERSAQLIRCVDSVLSGSRPPEELIVVVDRNPDLVPVLCQSLPVGTIVVENAGDGLSDARNTGAASTSADVVVWIDDDAWAEHEWLEQLLGAFDDDAVIGAGGYILPEWEPDAVALPPELWWVVGSTYKGHTEAHDAPITRPIGANMAVRRAPMLEICGFLSEFGPHGGQKTSSNDELALFTRLRARHGTDCVRFAPRAVVHHHAPAERTSWRYLLERCVVEGRSKADARSQFGNAVMGHDRSYVRGTLVPAIATYSARSLVDRDRTALRHAAALSTALVVTATAYLTRLAGLRSHHARGREDQR